MYYWGKKTVISILFLFLTVFENATFCTKMLKLEYGKNKEGDGELTIEFLSYLNNIFNINTFIETGTYLGSTTKNAAKVFNHVETVELAKDLYERAKDVLKTEKNIAFYHGDSGTMLKAMIQNAKGNMLFWLDSHYSFPVTALGTVNTPILEELKSIKESGIKNAVILIDDLRLFDKYISKIDQKKQPNIGGYPTVERIYSILLDINPNYDVVILGDMILAYEKNDSIKVSEVLRATTLIRVNHEVDLDTLMNAEHIISKVEGSELEAIQSLYQIVCQRFHILYDAYGIGSHYALWYALTLLNNNQKNKALEILNGPINLGMDKSYIISLINRIHLNKYN